MGTIIQNTRGKLKIASPLLMKPAADELKKALCTIYGIGTIDFNPEDGSLLVNYDRHRTRHDDIIKLLERKGFY